ncbi:uncharacterized protein LOC115744794 isoform X1 [Rhodamnia argentea]|uniref:Uncharacterized protein LOC115744794 isoform X1 n=1 Tax=Rhodamnia argentea TaxID=178133 RepID=A0A8B8PML0_9MYRT|nr:uncharacterized protein LOC115744794 isoform X1 [Rhodamnia argentea]XP_030536030.1 uncharacterized protein LOC115744794 isoform X1 [Rhodamnia argentea]XP_048138719.1 uncharacterized protein LOC115744794 isoform X1 [Rhodamnia argentea]
MDLNSDEVECLDDNRGLDFVEKELEACRFSAAVDRGGSVEERIVRLELENRKWKSDYEALKDKFKALEAEKQAIECEVGVLKQENSEIKKQISGFECDKGCKSGDTNGAGVKKFVDLIEEQEEEDKVLQLMIENRVLECEKNKAERDLEVLRQSLQELESRVLQMEANSNSVAQAGHHLLNGSKIRVEFPNELAEGVSRRKEMDHLKESCGGHWDARMVDLVDVGFGCETCATPPNFTMQINSCDDKGEKEVACLQYGRRARKKLLFKEEESPGRKMAPSTPGVAKPHTVGIIDIHDSDEEEDKAHDETCALDNQENSKGLDVDYRSCKGILEGGKAMTIENSARTCHEEDYHDSIAGDEDNSTVLTPKRKRAFNVIETDSESGDDDCVPIGRLKRMHLQELYKPGDTTSEMNQCQTANASPGNHVKHAQTPMRQRLMTLRNREAKAKAKQKSSSGVQHHHVGPTTEDAETEDSEDFGLDSDNDSLSNFIVDDSDASDGDDASGQSEDTSDGETDFGEILSRIKRSKDHKSEWKFEADMLAAFAKEPELCMKAVCALYRQQTADERISKEALHSNQRGFSKFDARRGCALGEFLTDGDPSGGLTKSVEELEEHDPAALDLCRKLADHYSKQLFQIYKNNEDPFFFPS